MNPELQMKLVEVISGIQAGVAKASDFAVEQLPDIAHQYITYGRFLYSFEFIGGGFLGILSVGLLFFSIIKLQKAEFSKHPQFVAGVILSVILGFASIAATISSFASFALVWFAPKIYLIKSLAELLK